MSRGGFPQDFKVRVEFDEEMVMSDAVVRQYGGRLRQLSEQEGIGHSIAPRWRP